MGQRIDLASLVPDLYTAMVGLEKAIHRFGIDPILYELIKIRASQINGCARCLDMHLREARRGGESQRRLDIVSAWREAPSYFSDAERAALALTEETTLIADDVGLAHTVTMTLNNNNGMTLERNMGVSLERSIN